MNDSLIDKNEVILRLLAPSAFYMRIAAPSSSSIASDDQNNAVAQEVIDGLELTADLNVRQQDLPDELSDISADASINEKSKKQAIDIIREIGCRASHMEKSQLEAMQTAMVDDLQNLSSILFGNSGAVLRSMPGAIDAAQEWMEVVDRCEGFPKFIDFAIRLLSPEDVRWLLSVWSPPENRNDHLNVNNVLPAISDKILGPSLDPLHEEIIREFVGWTTKAKKWKDSPTTSSMFLVSYLLDPQKRLCKMLTDSGYKFCVDNVPWRHFMSHLTHDTKSLSVDKAQAFIVKHAAALAQGWPEWASRSASPNAQYNRFSVSGFSLGCSLRDMLFNIEKEDARAAVEASIDHALLSMDRSGASAIKPPRRM